MSTSILVGIVAWLAAALLLYVFLRNATLNLLDPVVIASISVPFSAALLAVLVAADLISPTKLFLFATVLVAYLAGASVVGMAFVRDRFRQNLVETISNVGNRRIAGVVVITLCITAALAFLAVSAGALGDSRQGFSRSFRPLALIQNGFFLVSILLLASPTLPTSRAFVWLCALMLLSIPFSGKSVFLPVIYWFGLKIYIQGRKLNPKALISMIGTFTFGVAIMGTLAYGVTSLAGAFLLLTSRLWLSGDVYILAYQQGALGMIRADYQVSFLSYMLHPITSLFGIRGYEKPLGAMLASEVSRDNVFTGPNPQLPVVLDYFFPDSIAASFAIAFIIGFMVIGMRLLGGIAEKGRGRYVRVGACAASIFCPALGFLDTSQVIISLIGILSAVAGLTILELVLSTWRKEVQCASAHSGQSA